MKNESGFTLLEIIVSLMLLGVMGVVAGMGLTTVAKGYMVTTDNAEITQKSQLAMGRIGRELRELLDVEGVNPALPGVSYRRFSGTATITRTVYYDSGTNTINVASGSTASGGHVLMDRVSGFALGYLSGSGTWNFGDAIDLLSAIAVEFHVSNGAGTDLPFSTKISLRNNGNAGGSAPPSPTNPPVYTPPSGCFVASAATQGVSGGQGRGRGGLLLFLVSLAGGALAVSCRKTVCSKAGDERGAVLLAVIITMVIVALLGAAMMRFTTTSTFSEIGRNSSIRAYYLAEAGYRYASSIFVNAGADQHQKIATLETINGMNGASARKLGAEGAEGKFELSVAPHFLVLDGNHVAGVETLQVKYPGEVPTEGYSIPSSGTFDIDTDGNARTVNTYAYDGSFNIVPPLGADMPGFSPLRFVAAPAGDVTVNLEENLPLVDAGPFPLRNGTFMVRGSMYAYERKVGNTLVKVRGADDPAMGMPLTLTAGDNVVCNEFITLKSVGTVGGDGGALATSREVNYYLPIGFFNQVSSGAEGTQEHTDSMQSLDGWFGDEALGPHGVTTVGGNSAMTASTVETERFPTGASWSFIAQKAVSFTLTEDLLDYDVQTKVETSLDYYLMGLGFRSQSPPGGGNDIYTYGLSYFRSRGSSDDVPNVLVPTDGDGSSLTYRPMVLLWQRTAGGYSWLAYKKLGHTIEYTNRNREILPYNWGSRHDRYQIRGTSSGATAEIYADEPSGNRTGTIVVGDIIGTFQNGETLQRRYGDYSWFLWWSWLDWSGWSSCATLGSISIDPMVDGDGVHPRAFASLAVRVDEERQSIKLNFIRCYFGSVEGYGTPASPVSPTDPERKPYSRWPDASPAAQWPPDSVAGWSSANKYFTLVRWDRVNSGVSGLSVTGADSEAGCVLRSTALTSDDFDNRSEVGLLSSGFGTGTTYFDDFAVRYEGSGAATNYGFLSPIQQ